MWKHVEVIASIDHPVEQVFDYLADPTRWHEFAPAVVSRRQIGDGQPGIGTRWTAVDRIGPMKIRFTDEPRNKHASKCPPFAIDGGALMILRGLLSWSFDNRILGDISVRFYPLGIQLYSMLFGVLAVILGVLLLRRPPWMSPAREIGRAHA